MHKGISRKKQANMTKYIKATNSKIVIFRRMIFLCGLFFFSFVYTQSLSAAKIKGIQSDGSVYICPGSSSTTLEIEEPEDDATYEWYSDAGMKRGTGNSISITTEGTIYLRELRAGVPTPDVPIVIKKLTNEISVAQIETPGAKQLCKGSTIELTTSASGADLDGSETYTWLKDGEEVGNGTSLNATEGGNYQMVVSFKGCNVSSNMRSILPPPTISVSGGDALCSGGSLNLIASGMDSYIWSGENISPISNGMITITEAGQYTISGTKDGCTDKYDFTINKKEALDIELDGKTAFCAGETETELTAVVNATDPKTKYTYQWMKDNKVVSGATSKTLKITEEGTYKVVVIDATSLCMGQTETQVAESDKLGETKLSTPNQITVCAGTSRTVQVSGTNITKALWIKENGDTLNSNEAKMTFSTNGKYTIVGLSKDNCPSTLQDLEVTLVDNPYLSFKDVRPCLGDTVELETIYNDTTGLLTWIKPDFISGKTDKSIKIFQDGEYAATVLDLNTSCSSTNKILIEFIEKPTITLSGENELCKNAETTISATVLRGEESSYLWKDENGIPILAMSDKLTVSTPGTYTFTAQNANGCEHSESFTILEKNVEIPKVKTSKEFLCGDDDQMTLTIDASIAGNTYVWSFGGVSQGTGESFNAKLAGTYTLTTTGANGCSADTLVEVASRNKAEITFEVDTICEGDKGNIKVKTNVPCTYLWDDGSTSDVIEFDKTQKLTLKVTETSSGCTKTETIDAIVHDLPSLLLSPKKEVEICNGDEAELSASSTADIDWSTGYVGGSIKVSTQGKYYVTATDPMWGCKVKDSINVIVRDLPTIGLKSDKDTICLGDNVELTASGADTYSWFENDSYTGETANIYTPKPQALSEYKVKGSKKIGNIFCTAESPVKKIFVNEPLTLQIDGKKEFCTDSSSTLKAVGSAVAFYWNNETTASQTYKATKTETVKLTGIDKAGCKTTLEEIVVMRNVPTITPAQTDYTICEQDSIQIFTLFSTTSSGYSWNGNPLTQSGDIMVKKAGTYTVVGYDEIGCPSDQISIDVKEVESPKATIDGGQYICEENDSLVLKLNITGDYTSILWSNGAKEDSITIKSGGKYSAKVYNGTCEALPAEIEVEEKPSPTISIDGPDEFCTDSTITLKAVGDAVSYYWNNETTSKTELTVSSAGEYTLWGVNGSNCKTSATKIVSQRDIPQLKTDTEKAFCENDSVRLTVKMDKKASGYSWDGKALTKEDWIYASEERTYTVRGYDDLMCPTNLAEINVVQTKRPSVIKSGRDYVCDGGDPTAIAAEVTGFYDKIIWSNGEVGDTAHLSKSGTYSVVASLGDCQSEEYTFTMGVMPTPNVTIAEGTMPRFCDQLDLTLHAESPTAVSYEWQPSGETTDSLVVTEGGTYTVTVTDANGCKKSLSSKVTTLAGPTISLSGTDSICQYSKTTISSQCSDCFSYQWSTGSTDPSIEVSAAGEYKLVGYNSFGCPSEEAIYKLSVIDAPVIRIEGETEITNNDSTTITANVFGSNGPYTYEWSPTHETTESLIVRASDFHQLITHSVTVVDRFGCTNFASITIAKRSIKLDGKREFCEGDSTIITAVGKDITSVLWSTGETTPSIVIKESGRYDIIAWHYDGTQDTVTFDIIEDSLPTFRLEGNRAFCIGDSTTIYAKGNADRYIWNDAMEKDSMTIYDKSFNTVKAISIFGCEKTDTFSTFTYNLPDVAISGPSAVIEGETIFLEASGASSYHWEKPDTVAQKIEVGEAMRYRVVGTDVNGCKNSAVHDVELIEVPHVYINKVENGLASICDRNGMKLIASGAETYTWDDGSTSDTLLATESRIYTVEGCFSNGQCKKQTFNLTLLPLPQLKMIEGNTHFCPDSSTTLKAIALEDSTIDHYEWNTGEHTQSIFVTDEGTYSVKVISTDGCASDSLPIEIVHFKKPTITLSGVLEVCDGTETTIKASGANKYSWINDGIDSDVLVTDKAGQHMLRVWNTQGCVSDTSVFITPLGSLKINILGQDTICEGNKAILHIGGSALANTSYTWSNGEVSDSIIVDKAGLYTATLSNGGNCFATDSINVVVLKRPTIELHGPSKVCKGDYATIYSEQLSGDSIASYLWSNGSTSDTLKTTVYTTHTAIAIDIHGCKSNPADWTLDYYDITPITISGDFDLCADQEDVATVTASNPDALNYTWIGMNDTILKQTVDLTKAGSYLVITTDANKCYASEKVEIIERPKPIIKIKGAELPVCNESYATLIAEDSTFISYLWSNGETTPYIKVKEGGDYSVTVKSKYGCTNQDSAHLIYNDIEGVTLSGDYSFCKGDSTILKVSGAETYKWSTGTEGDEEVFKLPNSESVTAIDKYGCMKKIDFEIEEKSLPNASLIAYPKVIRRTAPSVLFNVESDEDISLSTFSWDLGDGDTQDVRTFTHDFDFTQAQNFNVSLTLTSKEGCETKLATIIYVELEVPNTITPNGDGVNDYFMEGYYIEIYDRHGACLYKGDEGWDGKLPDGTVTADTYYYILKDMDGDEHRGYITVRR